MKLPRGGREYWHPELGTIPPGSVAVKAEFGDGVWIDLITVDGERVVLVAHPELLDPSTYPTPTEAKVLPLGRSYAQVMLVGPGSKEVVIRQVGEIDVESSALAVWPTQPDSFEVLLGTRATKAAMPFSPLDYAAAGNGTTNDAAAITATLTAATVGSVIDLGGRTYNTATQITIGKQVTIQNGTLTAANVRPLLVNAANVTLRNVTVTRTGSTRGAAESAITWNGTRGLLDNVTATSTIGEALRMANGTCDGTTILGGNYSTSDPNDAIAIQLVSGGTHNYDITVERATVRHTGYGTGIALYNCTRSTVKKCDVRSIRRSPWVTTTGWTLVTGTTYRTLDRTDIDSNAVWVDGIGGTSGVGTEYTKSGSATAPAAGEYSIDSGYIYINLLDGSNPSGHVIKTTRTNGYGILFYATTTETLGMSNNLAAENYVEDTDGFGIYFQTLQNTPRGNRTHHNTCRNVCLMGTPVTSLPFAGMGFFSGNDISMVGDRVFGTGEKAPGIRIIQSSLNTIQNSARLTNVTVDAASGAGISMNQGEYILTGCRAVNNGSHGYTSGTAEASANCEIQLTGCVGSTNTGSGGNFIGSGMNIRVTVTGGQYASNTIRGIDLGLGVRDSSVIGAVFKGNTQYGLNITTTSTNSSIVVTGNKFLSGQGLNVASGVAGLKLGPNAVDASSGTKYNIAATNYSTGHNTYAGTGSPESVLTAPVGSMYTRTDGAASTTFYLKETGAAATGWRAV